MAISNVQGWKNNSTASSPCTIAFTSSPTAGNTLFACFAIYSGGSAVTQPVVTDTLGNVWLQDKVVGQASDGQSYVFRCSTNVSTGANTVSMASSGAAEIHMFIAEFNCGGIPTLDRSAAAFVTSSTAINSGTTAQRTFASELLIGFAQGGGPSNPITAMTGGAWVSQIGSVGLADANNSAAEYLISTSNIPGTDAVTGTSTAAQNNQSIVCTYCVAPPVAALSAGFTRLAFTDDFDAAPDIGFNTRGHKWNGGLWWQTLPDTASFTQTGSVSTITALRQIATTNGPFTVPAANTAVAIVSTAATLVVGDTVKITDGTRVLIGDVTIVTDTTHFTANTRTWAGNVTGIMTTGSPIKKVEDVELCTQEKSTGTGSYWRGGYFEARMNCTDWSSFVLYAAAKPPGPQIIPVTLSNTVGTIVLPGSRNQNFDLQITVPTALLSVGDLISISDGTSTLVCAITTVSDSTHISINTSNGASNPVSVTIATNATIKRANPFNHFSEIDIIETDPVATTTAVTTLHYNTNAIGLADYQNAGNNNTVGSSTVGAFNIFGCLWTQSTVSWYFNNALVTSCPASTNNWQQHFLSIASAPNGINGGVSTVNPPTNQVDWVRVWQPPLPSPGGTITNVQPFTEAHASAATVSKAFTNPVTAGNKLFVCAYTKPAFIGMASITDTLGNNYVPLSNSSNSSSGGGGEASIYYCESKSGGACTVTAAIATVTYVVLHIAEFNFSGGQVVIDQQTNTVDGTAATAMTSGVTGTRIVANELLVGFMLPQGGATATVLGPGWTGLIASDSLSMAQYKIVSVTGTDASTGTQSGVQTYTGLVATFYSAGPTLSVNPRLYSP